MEQISFVIDLEPELTSLEILFNKYIPDDPLHLFCIGRRFPLNGVEKSQLDPKYHAYLSHLPFYPYKCIKYVEACIIADAYNQSPYYEYFDRNKLIPNGGVSFTDFCKYDFEDLLTWSIDKNELLIDDTDAMINVVSRIVSKVSKFLEPYANRLITLNLESEIVIVNIGEDIGIYRYNEALEYQQAQLELQQQEDEFCKE